jgi:hypothetical protein
METQLPSWLWPVAILTALGGAIDFLLGRVGQARAKSVLEDWWIRFDDVSRYNFGKKEASFAVAIFDTLFGQRFFTLRRILVSFLIIMLFVT